MLYPKNNTLPGEVLLELATDVIEERAVRPASTGSSSRALATVTLPKTGRTRAAQHQKAEYALRAAAMVKGGVDPRLLDEAMWWRTDDPLLWALEALVTHVRASAEHSAEARHRYL